MKLFRLRAPYRAEEGRREVVEEMMDSAREEIPIMESLG
jgi:hypothetical protein